MDRKASSASAVLALLAASMPALTCAQPQPGAVGSAATQPAQTDFHLSPLYGQDEEKQWFDRYECDTWARWDSRYDPHSRQTGPAQQAAAEAYRRAMSGCLEQHGYGVSYAPPPPPPPAPYVWLRAQPSAPRELHYRAFAVQAGGGYTVAAGSTAQDVRDGANAAVALTWFPSAALPIGVRVDGSYTWFKPASQLLALDNVGYNRGQRDVYGGDVDLRLNLAPPSARQQLYLVGGVGWYRVSTLLQKVSEVRTCGLNFCGVSQTLLAQEHDVSPWLRSWNAGVGWEIALDSHTSFFIEASYRRIQGSGGPSSSRPMQLVPIRLGLRF